MIEYGEIFADAVENVWTESRQEQTFDRDMLLGDAARYKTLMALAEQIPAGFLQFGVEDGRITLILSHPGARNADIGTQLIGRAVMEARGRGCGSLRIALPVCSPHKDFFRHVGFEQEACLPDGREVFRKKL